MARAARKTDESLIARFTAATEAARRHTLRKVNTADPAYEDYAPLSYWRERWSDLRVQQRFLEKWLLVRDGFDSNRLVPFVLTDLQKWLHYHSTDRFCVVKGRGAQSTRYWLARKFADAVVLSGRKVRIVPQDPDTEDELFADIKVFYANLPDHLRVDCRYNSKELFHIHDPEKGTTDSTITTLSIPPGHEGKGRGMTITDLVVTELPFWRCDAKTAMRSLMQSLRGGSIVDEGTASGLETHYENYIAGKNGRGGWSSKFFAWYWNRNYRLPGAFFLNAGTEIVCDGLNHSTPVDPSERRLARRIYRHLREHKHVKSGAGWDCDEVASYLAWRRAKVEEIGPAMFAVEYPENDKDCFEQSGRPVIAAQYLKVTKKPSEALDSHEYLIGGDPSAGLATGNPGAIQVVDLNTGLQAKEIVTRDKPEVFAQTLCDLSDSYNGANLIVERNGLGLAVVNAIVRNGYEDRLFRQLTAAQKRSVDDGSMSAQEAWEAAQPGLQTTTVTKQLMGYALERQIRSGEIGLTSESFCENAKRVVWFDNGSFGVKATADNSHADDFMALAFVAYVREYELGSQQGFVGVLPEFGAV